MLLLRLGADAPSAGDPVAPRTSPNPVRSPLCWACVFTRLQWPYIHAFVSANIHFMAVTCRALQVLADRSGQTKVANRVELFRERDRQETNKNTI